MKTNFRILLMGIMFPLYASSQYNGGNSDGQSEASLFQSACNNGTSNIFTGGAGPDVSYGVVIQSNCLLADANIALGGDADGATNAELIQSNCLLVDNNVSLGGINDGAAYSKLIQSNCLLITNNIAIGGIADGFSKGVLLQSINCIPIPVMLLYFNTNCNNNLVQFKWATATENDNSHFTILQSIDGVNFVPVATIAGANNSNSIKEYAYTINNNIANVLYYKLAQTDFSGSETYSAINKVSCSPAKRLLIYPNPASNQFIIERTANSVADIYIIDAMGKKVLQQKIANTVSTLDIKNLPAGLYTISIVANGETAVQKLIIRR